MKQKDKIKVRFNLSRGVNYMKWKIGYPNGDVEYLEPSEYNLILYKCILKNYKKTAYKIFNGGNKTVCSWILCESIDIIKTKNNSDNINVGNIISYNPRVKPYWVYDNKDSDGMVFDQIHSYDRILINENVI